MLRPGAGKQSAPGREARFQVWVWSLISQFDCAEQRGRDSLSKLLKVTLSRASGTQPDKPLPERNSSFRSVRLPSSPEMEPRRLLE